MTDSAHRPQALQVPGWETIPGLVHGFYGRRGGVSRGVFAELNLSFRVGDAPDAVQENWRRVRSVTVDGMRFATMQQVHGTRVAMVEDGSTDAGEADAAVTPAAGVALSVLTADCVPILLVAPRQHVVAAVHAGWRGTVAGIAERAVYHLNEVFGVERATLRAALGPAIGGCCYEVDRNIVDELEQRWGAMPDVVREDAVRTNDGLKAMLDLRRANAAILVRAGVPPPNISTLGMCTKCAVPDYFSYRAVNGPTGRQLSFIGWQAR